MWLTKKIENQTKKTRIAEGAMVTSSASSHLDAKGTKAHASVPCVSPFGIVSLSPDGSRTVILPLDNGSVSLGVIQPELNNLERGEVMLYSAGGATIVLKNDGRVLINGKAVN